MSEEEQDIEEEEERDERKIAEEVRCKIKRIFQLSESEGDEIGISVDSVSLSYEQQRAYGVSTSMNCYTVFISDKHYKYKTWGYICNTYKDNQRIINILSVSDKNAIDEDSAKELIALGAEVFFRSESAIGCSLKINNDKPDSYYCYIPVIEYRREYSYWVNWCD